MCIVFVIAEVCEVGATQVDVSSQNIGVRRASYVLWLKSVKGVRPQLEVN